MSEEMKEFALPPSVVSRVDLAHLVNELEQIDGEKTTAEVHEKVGVSGEGQMAYSRQLSDFLTQNSLEIGDSKARTDLIKRLRTFKEKVPVIHMTFAVSADRESLQKLAAYVRESVHPQAVIEIGLQPALIAGVNIRTPNHVHDMSMRAMLREHHGDLVKELEALRGER